MRIADQTRSGSGLDRFPLELVGERSEGRQGCEVIWTRPPPQAQARARAHHPWSLPAPQTSLVHRSRPRWRLPRGQHMLSSMLSLVSSGESWQTWQVCHAVIPVELARLACPRSAPSPPAEQMRALTMWACPSPKILAISFAIDGFSATHSTRRGGGRRSIGMARPSVGGELGHSSSPQASARLHGHRRR